MMLLDAVRRGGKTRHMVNVRSYGELRSLNKELGQRIFADISYGVKYLLPVLSLQGLPTKLIAEFSTAILV